LIAELKWAPDMAQGRNEAGQPIGIPQSLVDPSRDEEFFHRFSGAIYQHGFKQTERLVPLGMPLPHGSVVYRYRHENTKTSPILVQIGPGLFSTNALPPYKSWSEFRPWLELSLSALLKARTGVSPFKVSVRYIDAFSGDITQEKTIADFFDSELGFKIVLPDSISKLRHGADSIRSSLSMTIPLDGMQMIIKLGEGYVRGGPAGILDTQVTIVDEIEPDLGIILGARDNARQVIHDSFMDLVNPIINTLLPE